jgi:hypothetical protein
VGRGGEEVRLRSRCNRRELNFGIGIARTLPRYRPAPFPKRWRLRSDRHAAPKRCADYRTRCILGLDRRRDLRKELPGALATAAYASTSFLAYSGQCVDGLEIAPRLCEPVFDRINNYSASTATGRKLIGPLRIFILKPVDYCCIALKLRIRNLVSRIKYPFQGQMRTAARMAAPSIYSLSAATCGGIAIMAPSHIGVLDAGRFRNKRQPCGRPHTVLERGRAPALPGRAVSVCSPQDRQ